MWMHLKIYLNISSFFPKQKHLVENYSENGDKEIYHCCASIIVD